MPSPPPRDERAEPLYRLAAGTAHDLNNLLTLVVGCADLALADEALTPTSRQLLEDIASFGERATLLTRQFLMLSRPSTAPTTPVDVTVVLRSAKALLERAVGDRVRLHLDLGTQAKWVLAEPSQLEQIVLNLAVNARDAMPAGGVLTIASTPGVRERPDETPTRGRPAPPMTRLTVTDTGHGIAPTIREPMDEPFVTTKSQGKGAGLGLAVVQTIVGQLGGAIALSTTPGRGTTFTIDLPLAAAPRSSPAPIERRDGCPP